MEKPWTEAQIFKALDEMKDEIKNMEHPAKPFLVMMDTLGHLAEMARVSAMYALLNDGFTGFVEITHEQDLDEMLKDYK